MQARSFLGLTDAEQVKHEVDRQSCFARVGFYPSASHQLSISSRLRPLVSGTASFTNKTAATQTTA